MDQRRDQRDAPEDRSGPLRRLSRRTSVWHYLVALAILPSIGVTAMAGLFTQDRIDEVRAAERIDAAASALRSLDGLRLAIDAEAGASVVDDTLADLGTTAAAVNRIARAEVTIPLPQARRATRDALVEVRGNGTSVTAGRIDRIAMQVESIRRSLDETKAGTPAERRARSWNVVTAFRRVSAVVAGLERTSTDAIVTGRHGPGSSALQLAASELEEVSRVGLLGGRRATAFFLLYVAPPDAAPGILRDLRDADAAYRVAASELPTLLTARLRTRWQAFASAADTAAFDAVVATVLSAPGTAAAPSQGITQILSTGRSIGVFTQGLIGLLLDAVDGVASTAAGDRAAAVDRARNAIAVTAVLLGLTVTALLVLGGTIRWRLRDLAAAAQRFSSGELEPVTVRGPREIALASEGLNDAVANLRRVTTSAERLAAGDLSAPDLRQATPGPLGAAVHASVSRVADALRERERLQLQLTHQATHDALTGLANRAEGERLLTEALEQSRREGTRIGLLFVDLDHFKAINDTHGHHAGDHVLQVSATRMEAQVRGRDAVCRFGGDEFVILLDPVESEFAAIDIGERIVAVVGEPITYEGHELFVGASVGAATVESGAIGAEELLGRSDTAVYRAKAAGRGGVVSH